jgi:hypothetical protein
MPILFTLIELDKDFEDKRKKHYDEFKVLKKLKESHALDNDPE